MENIFQSREWEEFKKKTGYQKSFRVENVLVLKKNLPLGYSMLYSPMVSDSEKLKVKGEKFLSEVKEIAEENKSIFYRLELDIPNLSTFDFPLLTRNFVKSFEELQPKHTWILNLDQSAEEILAGMSLRCRYNVRHAEKQKVIVKSGTDKEKIDFFYNLYSVTGKRHGITFRDKNYFASLISILGESGQASIYTAEKEIDGKMIPLSAGILVYSGKKAIYMFGASSYEFRNLKAPNLLVWQMILDAKIKDSSLFDFFGIAPNDNPSHPWAGITSFKKQWGGEGVEILGSYDMVILPFQYQIFKIAEKIRR